MKHLTNLDRSAAPKKRCGQPIHFTMAVKFVLAAVALSALVGCPEPDEGVIRTLPSPPSPPPPRQWQQPPPRQPAEPAQPPRTTNLSGKTVMIDPGHGGKDVGAWKSTKSRMPEKDIVLDIGNRVNRTLKSRGAKVIATRTTDVYPTLDQRANAADRYKVDLFVSIHADSAPKNPAAAGTEVHIYTSASSQSRAAKDCMVAALRRAGLDCRGFHESNLHVLREHSRPAMLIECGFLTNSGDATRLNTAAYRAKVADAIAEGITDYLSRR